MPRIAKRSVQVMAIGVGLLLGSACSSGSSAPPPGVQPSCLKREVDRFKELIVVEPSVLGDARSQNATGGAWSFRHAIEAMVPDGTSPSDFVMKWLTEWVTLTELNGFPLDRKFEERNFEMNRRVICPWLHSTPANACNDDCSTCASKTLDLSLAPFRLIAIANRMDLREKPDAAGPAGEGRLIFALTDTTADKPTAVPRPMTVNFEYRLPNTLSLKGWGEAWHALGDSKAFDEPYRVALQAITDRYSSRGADPARPNGSSLAQLRTNESFLNWIWQLREFHLDSDGLHLSTVKNTPSESFNGSSALVSFIKANSANVLKGTHVVPESMLGGSIDELLVTWAAPGIDEPTRKAFAKETCNGCHVQETVSIDTAFHVSPFKVGVDKVSPFLNDPKNPKGDELGRRAAMLDAAICK